MKPFFSIIVPVYNAAAHMRKGLDSIAAAIQEYEKIGGAAELIIVCDSCTDVSVAIAKEYTDKVYEVEYHRDGLTRNKGLSVATGDWILFMDDDDWWLHEYVLCELSNHITIYRLEEKSHIGGIAFAFIWKGIGYIPPVRTHGEYWPAVWSKAWKKDAISGCRFSDKWSCSDMDFNKEVYKKWRKEDLYFQNWDMPIYYYNCWRKGSITEGDGKLKPEDVKL